MKFWKVLFITLSLSPLTMAKNQNEKQVDMKGFSQALNEEINQRIEQNPQKYETRPLRAPASMGGIEIEEVQRKEDLKDLKQFKNQAIGRPGL